MYVLKEKATVNIKKVRIVHLLKLFMFEDLSFLLDNCQKLKCAYILVVPEFFYFFFAESVSIIMSLCMAFLLLVLFLLHSQSFLSEHVYMISSFSKQLDLALGGGGWFVGWGDLC